MNRDAHPVLLAKFRICVKTAGDGVASGNNTTLPPTEFERNAVVYSQASCPALSSERLAQLAAMGKKDEVAPPPDPIIENLRQQIAVMEQEQDRRL